MGHRLLEVSVLAGLLCRVVRSWTRPPPRDGTRRDNHLRRAVTASGVRRHSSWRRSVIPRDDDLWITRAPTSTGRRHQRAHEAGPLAIGPWQVGGKPTRTAGASRRRGAEAARQ